MVHKDAPPVSTIANDKTKWAIHFAVMPARSVCLRDTVPIRSRTWTFRRPAILHTDTYHAMPCKPSKTRWPQLASHMRAKRETPVPGSHPCGGQHIPPPIVSSQAPLNSARMALSVA